MAPLRASLARSPPRLGRSQAGGLHPQDPQGCAPWRAFAHRAPAASVTQPEGFRARVRPVAGVVNRLRLSTLDAQPLPLSPGFSFSKARQPERGQAAGLSTGGRQSLQRRRLADLGTARQGGCPPWVGSEVVHGQSGPQGRALDHRLLPPRAAALATTCYA